MANVKEVVSLLCNLIEEIGCSTLQPETFRLGKFDDPSVIPDLWRLLFEIVTFARTGTVNQLEDMPTVEQAMYIKKELFLEGYHVDSFIALSPKIDDPSGRSSSRELLLAFGWFLANSTCIELFTTRCADIDKLFVNTLKKQLSLIDARNQSVYSDKKQTVVNDIENQVREAVVTNGKIQAFFKSIARGDHEYATLLRRLECTPRSPDIASNPATFNVAISGDVSLMEEAVKLLERDKMRLTSLVHWRKHEHTFWLWLESVLEEQLKNPTEIDPDVLKECYSQLLSRAYAETTDFLLQASRSEKILRDRLKDVPHEDIDRIVENVNNDLEDYLKPRSFEKSPKRSAKPSTSRSLKNQSDHETKSAEEALKQLCDRFQFEMDVNCKEFSERLRRLAEENLDA